MELAGPHWILFNLLVPPFYKNTSVELQYGSSLIKKKKIRTQVLHFKQVVVRYRKIYKMKLVETISVYSKCLTIKDNLLFILRVTFIDMPFV